MNEPATKRCPYCAEEIRSEAVKCRFCGSILEARSGFSGPWYRREQGKMIAGVCTGLAAEFGVSVTVVRLAFILAVVLGWGIGLIIYVALWMIMPYGPDERDFREEDRADNDHGRPREH